MAFSSNSGGAYLNVATDNGAIAGISTFLINQSSGQLTPVSNVSMAGATFSGLAVNASGNILYGALATTTGVGQVVPFTVGTDGSLTQAGSVNLMVLQASWC